MTSSPAPAGPAFDVDWIVVGSGFGGSVSALRLAEKGYSVLVLESGRRFADGEFPTSTWDSRNYFFAPRLGCTGFFRLSVFKDVAIASGAGVGGGSLGYANTLYRPPRAFYDDPQWAGLEEDWGAALQPHYDTAERMLGVRDVVADDPADRLLREWGRSKGIDGTYRKARVGVYLENPGETVPDPYFDGEGPERTGCRACGRCMVGCPHGSKNTLVKNYLWLAERRGVRIEALRTAVDIRPLDGASGATGWEVVHVRTGLGERDKRTVRARGVVAAAGALGTNKLLARAKLSGSLPRLSGRLGELVRTNSEAVLAVTVPDGALPDLQRRVAITSSVYPDPHTHVETVVYGDDGSALKLINTLMVGDGTRVTRPLKLLGQIARHPVRFVKLLTMRNWSRRTIIVLVMQSLDNAIALRARRSRFGGVRLQTEQDPLKPNPTFLPIANEFTAWLARRTGGIAQSSVFEAVANIPATAHILGGATIGATPDDGVVDSRQRVHGYDGLLVCDGSAIPANVGVNPSLTITAMAERAMSFVPAADADAPVRHVGVEPEALAA